MSLEVAVQIGTLISVIIGIISFIFAVRIYKRQTNSQIFLAYTDRYEKIMQSYPPDALQERLNLNSEPPPESRELSLAALRYLNLCSEEYYLQKKGYLAKDIWNIWEAELIRTLRSPLYLREWKKLRCEFEAYSEFLKYVEGIQAERQIISV